MVGLHQEAAVVWELRPTGQEDDRAVPDRAGLGCVVNEELV